MGKVVDGGALAQEFRVGADGEVGVGAELLQTPLDLAAGPNRHGRFGGDHGEAIEMRRKLLDSFEYEREVGMTVAAPHRRADGEKHEIGLTHSGRQVSREADASIAEIAIEQLLKP